MRRFKKTSLLVIWCVMTFCVGCGNKSEVRSSNTEKVQLQAPQFTYNRCSDKTPLKKRRSIKIATIGPRQLVLDTQAEPQEIVDKMIAHWKGKFAKVLPERPDLIVTPEICDEPAGLSGDKRRRYFRVRKNQVRDYFSKVAKENNCYIVYSAVREMSDGSLRNSSVMLDRKGNIAGIYNKNHLYMGENTGTGILYGREPAVIDCDFGRVGFTICFDLNFDQLRLKYAEAKPD